MTINHTTTWRQRKGGVMPTFVNASGFVDETPCAGCGWPICSCLCGNNEDQEGSASINAFIADYYQRMLVAGKYADECISILVQEHGADATKIDRDVFTSHHFSLGIDGNPPRPPAEQVAVALDTWRPHVLGLPGAKP